MNELLNEKIQDEHVRIDYGRSLNEKSTKCMNGESTLIISLEKELHHNMTID